jgi:hypothetical protein
MPRNLIPRIPILLSLTKLDDTELHSLAGRLKTASATSKLVSQVPAMATSITAMGAKDATLSTANQTVEDDRTKLHTDVAAEAVARTALVAEIRTFAMFATNNAQNAEDLHGAGLMSRDNSTPTLPPVMPGSIDILPPPKGHGKIRVCVHETGTTRRQYIAQQSADGINWTPLGLGHGKIRTVTGQSGAKVWVRFATIRGEAQSEWCTPAIVTIP